MEDILNEIIRQQIEQTEKTLADLITKYDFIVGSKYVKHKLMELLSNGANIICSPYIKDIRTIYCIKKIDIMELLSNEGRFDDGKN